MTIIKQGVINTIKEDIDDLPVEKENEKRGVRS